MQTTPPSPPLQSTSDMEQLNVVIAVMVFFMLWFVYLVFYRWA